MLPYEKRKKIVPCADADQSVLLKMHLSNVSHMDVAIVLKRERPALSYVDSLYLAKLLVKAHSVGVIRGKAVNNS